MFLFKFQVVVDVGCGPGLVLNELAPVSRKVVGVDATPAMLEKAKMLLLEQGFNNCEFIEGLMENIPIQSESVDAVVTRYTFHHVLQPSLAFSEMVRICKPGGRIVVFDSTPESHKRNKFDEFEKTRDPSHTSAMTLGELTGLASRHLIDVRTSSFPMHTKVIEILCLS